jgi:hypothetical protein
VCKGHYNRGNHQKIPLTHRLSYKRQLSYDEAIPLMQLTYRPYKPAGNFYSFSLSLLKNADIVTFAFENKLLTAGNSKYFNNQSIRLCQTTRSIVLKKNEEKISNHAITEHREINCLHSR